jgi:hypothetical protein
MYDLLPAIGLVAFASLELYWSRRYMKEAEKLEQEALAHLREAHTDIAAALLATRAERRGSGKA